MIKDSYDKSYDKRIYHLFSQPFHERSSEFNAALGFNSQHQTSANKILDTRLQWNTKI